MYCHIKTVCSPPNGALEAVVAGGNAGYSFEWYSNASSLGITTSTINGLVGNNYTVVVTRNGCTTTANQVVNDLAVEPDVTAYSHTCLLTARRPIAVQLMLMPLWAELYKLRPGYY
jgi:hypothetical protein